MGRRAALLPFPLIFLLILCLLAPRAPQAQEPAAPEAAAVAGENAGLIRRISDRLAEEESARSSLAQRIARSSLSDGAPADLGDISRWIEKNPEEAARLAAGFEQDDRRGDMAFERSLRVRVRRYLALNPDRDKGMLGVLKAAGSESKAILRLDKTLDEEEQRELVKRLFEGQGAESDGKLQRSPAADATAHGAIASDTGFYDRLSHANLAGFSPEVLTLQSWLNRQRPPGAPALKETGRLDRDTLLFPYYGLSHDLSRLRKYIADNKQASPGAAGAPGHLAAAEAPEGAASAPEAWLARAEAALKALRTEAENAKNPQRITLKTLQSLGAQQKEAARWISAASLKADQKRLAGLTNFWTAELDSLVRTAPAAPAVRDGYLSQVARLQGRLAKVAACDRDVLAMLTSADFQTGWSTAQRRLKDCAPQRRGLEKQITLVCEIPPALHAAWSVVPRWRAYLERLALWLLPRSTFSQKIALRKRRGVLLRDAFDAVASADFTRAENHFFAAR